MKTVSDAAQVHLQRGGLTMLQWLIRWASHQSAAPERLAERALHELRLELYQAEQHVLDAQMQADYYRTRIAFCEEVLKKGIKQVSDDRREQHEMSPPLRPGLKLSPAQSAVPTVDGGQSFL